MSVIRLASESPGANAGAFGAPTRLGELEQIPTDVLLHAWITFDVDITPPPEIVHALPLAGHELGEPLAFCPVERPFRAFTQLFGRGAP